MKKPSKDEPLTKERAEELSEILIKMIHVKPEHQAERFHFGFGQVVLGYALLNEAKVLIITRARRSHLSLGSMDPSEEPDYSHDGVELVFHNIESLQVLKGALTKIEEEMNAKPE